MAKSGSIEDPNIPVAHDTRCLFQCFPDGLLIQRDSHKGSETIHSAVSIPNEGEKYTFTSATYDENGKLVIPTLVTATGIENIASHCLSDEPKPYSLYFLIAARRRLVRNYHKALWAGLGLIEVDGNTVVIL